MTDRLSILTVYLSRPHSTRARLLYGIGILISFTLFFILNRMYEEISGLRSPDPMGLIQINDSFFAWLTRVIAFLITPYMLIPQLLQVLLLRQNDLIYEERSWKQQIRKLLQLQLDLWHSVGALVFGILISILFDMYISSSVHPLLIGWIARVVADIFVFALCAITIAVFVFRRS